MKYYKLPNGTIATANVHGVIALTTEVEVGELIGTGMTMDAVLDNVGAAAIGSVPTRPVSFDVIGHNSNMLRLLVTTTIEHIVGATEVPEAELPLSTYSVEITRIGTGSRTVTIDAKSESEAIEIAGSDAGDHVYPEKSSEYEFVAVQRAGT